MFKTSTVTVALLIFSLLFRIQLFVVFHFHPLFNHIRFVCYNNISYIQRVIYFNNVFCNSCYLTNVENPTILERIKSVALIVVIFILSKMYFRYKPDGIFQQNSNFNCRSLWEILLISVWNQSRKQFIRYSRQITHQPSSAYR